MDSTAAKQVDMKPPALHLQPLIGFAMWHLERGWTIDATREAIQKESRKRGFPVEKADEAIRQAIIMQGLTRQIQDYLATHHPMVLRGNN